jgi:UDP-glucose 4-epimerase
MTKALAEKMSVFYSQISDATLFNVVRYGNVLASRGSVVPLFIEKIQNSQDLPITNFDMTRFMLTLDDAVNLVEFALLNGTQGKLFVQKAKSFTLQQLVESLSQILDRQLPTYSIGARPGEKLHETLATSEELSHSVSHENYFEITPPTGDAYGSYYSGGNPGPMEIDFTSFSADRLTNAELIELIKTETNILQLLNR